MSLVIDIADAVVAELNAHTWTQEPESFTAARRYQPYLTPDDLTNLQVSVILRNYEGELYSRKVGRRLITLQILVQRELSDANADNDPLIELAEEIADHFEQWKETGTGAVCTSAQLSPIYAPDHVRDRVVTSIVELQFITHTTRG